MRKSIFEPASDDEIREELARETPDELIAFVGMRISFRDDLPEGDTSQHFFYRRQQIAREIIDQLNPPLLPWYSN